jgi:hypothetical protein
MDRSIMSEGTERLDHLKSLMIRIANKSEPRQRSIVKKNWRSETKKGEVEAIPIEALSIAWTRLCQRDAADTPSIVAQSRRAGGRRYQPD